MAHGYNTKLPNIRNYPGDGYYYIICDVCGKKIRRKDAVYIRDKFNLQNRLLVCKSDADHHNPQLRPFKAREYKAPKLTRSEPTDYYVSQTVGIAPTAPQQLSVTLDPINNYIDLFWLGPLDPGSQITGYIIYQSVPQLGPPTVINANTNSIATFYQDTQSPISGSYTYWVAAINNFGISSMSAPAFFPSLQVDLSIDYLAYSTTSVLSISPNNFLTVSN